MRKTTTILLFLSFLALTMTSCRSNKTGCRINDEAHIKMGSDGELPTRTGKSGLFSKKMKKKMR